jgi:hypothetical protein
MAEAIDSADARNRSSLGMSNAVSRSLSRNLARNAAVLGGRSVSILGNCLRCTIGARLMWSSEPENLQMQL